LPETSDVAAPQTWVPPRRWPQGNLGAALDLRPDRELHGIPASVVPYGASLLGAVSDAGAR
jgi:hypothetical protein